MHASEFFFRFSGPALSPIVGLRRNGGCSRYVPSACDVLSIFSGSPESERTASTWLAPRTAASVHRSFCATSRFPLWSLRCYFCDAYFPAEAIYTVYVVLCFRVPSRSYSSALPLYASAVRWFQRLSEQCGPMPQEPSAASRCSHDERGIIPFFVSPRVVLCLFWIASFFLCALPHQDVCSGRSGHAEVVLLEYDPSVVTYDELLDVFWKSHNPTQVTARLVP